MKFAYVPGNGGVDTAPRRPRVSSFGNVYAPHANTLRDTLTVPADKAYHLTFARLFMLEEGGLTTTGDINFYYTFQPNGGSESDLSRSFWRNSGEKTAIVSEVPLDVWAIEGDATRLYTVDVGVGGTIVYSAQLYYNEYDV